jgi:hypothetical protein
MMPRLTEAQGLSTIRITSVSSFHNYRWRLSLAAGDSEYDGLEKRLADAPIITVPPITL